MPLLISPILLGDGWEDKRETTTKMQRRDEQFIRRRDKIRPHPHPMYTLKSEPTP